MKEYLILDGYNVINAWPFLKSIGEENLDQARIQLTEMMAEYQSFKGIQIIIVFDGHLVKRNIEKKEKIKGIEIVFTKERETADGYIEKRIIHLSKKHRVVVATNDWAEQQMILGGGATRISVRELILDFEQVKTKIKRKTEYLNQQKDYLGNRIDKIIAEKLEKFRRSP